MAGANAVTVAEKGPAPVALTLEQLAETCGTTPRTARYYIERGVLPRPKFKASGTRYDHAYVVRLRAVLRLRETRMKLDAIKRKLAAASPDELLALAGVNEARPAAPIAEPTAATPAPAPPPRAMPESFVGPYRPALARASERWDHVAICPGVVLMVRGEADAEAWRVAREIVALFGGAAPA